jgi:hypothetical protein
VTAPELLAAVRAHDLAQVRAMLQARPELSGSRLHIAVVERVPEIVRVLMQHGANARVGIYPHRDATSPDSSAESAACVLIPVWRVVMRFKKKKPVLALFVGCSIAAWPRNADQDVAVAQGRTAVVITRIFTGPDGMAHAEDIELNLNARGATDMFKATGAEFSVRPPTAGADPRNTAATDAAAAGWHTGPARQFVITLSGRSEVEVSGGVHVAAGPGHINLIEDTTGKGHITRNFGPDDRIALTIPLADGVVIEGVRKARTR